MALIHCDFFSETLGLNTSMYVILPQPTSGRQIGITARGAAGDRAAGHPTLLLLHGLTDDHTIWVRRTSIERYVSSLGLAVVMPRVARSWYADMEYGLRYWTFISEELPAVARSFFPLSDRREDNFVAGLSMGGYGAFKLALRQPERFAAAASLSGVLDPARFLTTTDSHRLRELELIFGGVSRFPGSNNDTMALAERLAHSDSPRPALYACCGEADHLLAHNLSFRDHARQLGLDLTYEQEPNYGHAWNYWDLKIQRVLDWLPLPGRG